MAQEMTVEERKKIYDLFTKHPVSQEWGEKVRAEGRVEGRAEGRVERTREIICKYLTRKFGEKSAGLQQKVQQVTGLEALDHILEELFAVNTLEEARAIVNDSVGK